ncbi:hypothetical protein ACTQ56_10810, partial [[Clostridium] aminophilum]|uniref:hypothetical protein n=1 Tax=[Clostridium] aminophilum TaxID=1526 RepID=UPI003F95CFF4
FRFHLAMDTLAFGYILPTTGRIRDFHPLETCAAGRTANKNPAGPPPGSPRGIIFATGICPQKALFCLKYQSFM